MPESEIPSFGCRLQAANRFLTTGRSAALVAIAITLLAWVAYVTYYHQRFGLNFPPSATGDEPDYDSLGWELAQGHGFQLNTGDSSFRKPYEEAAKSSELYKLPPPIQGPVTYRPPLFPLLIAATDVVFGRQLWAVRIFNAFCMAATCGIVSWLLLKNWGFIPALIGTGLFIVLDTRTRLYGRAILTEALSTFLVAVLFLVICELSRRPKLPGTILAGFIFGVAVLARSLFILWLPGLLVLVGIIVVRHVDSQRIRQVACQGTAFLLAALLPLLPWMVRNCLVLKEFMPLGTQGSSQLSAGFSDYTWENHGLWPNLEQLHFFDEVLRKEMGTLERELVLAKFSRQRAGKWILAHPGKALALAPIKNYQEFRPRTAPEAILLTLAAFGASILWRHPVIKIGLALVATNCIAIGMTWSVEGRFMVPLLCIQHVLAAAGLWWLISRGWGLPRSADSTPE